MWSLAMLNKSLVLVGLSFILTAGCEPVAKKQQTRSEKSGTKAPDGGNADDDKTGNGTSGGDSDGIDAGSGSDSGSDSGNEVAGDAERPLTISFDPPTDASMVTEYRLYAAMNTATEKTLVAKLPAANIQSAKDHRFKIDAVEDEFLITRLGLVACFFVTAASVDGESPFSQSKCVDLLDSKFAAATP